MISRSLFGGFLILLIAGCTLKRASYDVPSRSLPSNFKNAASAPAEQAVGSNDQAGTDFWWRTFGNQELDSLIDRGMANNPDIKIATLRVAQAKVRSDQAQGGKWPTLSMPLSVGRGRAAGEGAATKNNIQAGLYGFWRPDLWGEQASLAEMTEFSVWQAAFEADNVRRNVAANIASSYIDYVSFNDRLKSTLETEKLLVTILSTLEKRVTAGDATMADLEQLRASIYSARATVPGLEQQREDAANSIAFLVGTVPTSLALSDAGLDTLRMPGITAGLPSTLLLRRPDVRMIEARMLAADADIDVARARVLPSLDLSTQAGYSGSSLLKLLLPENLFWNTLGSISASVFDGGKRAGDVAQSKMVHEEMVETYSRTIHQAIREVETALSTVNLTRKRLDSQDKATGAARRAWNISREIYTVGGIDFIALQDTERTYHRYLDDFQRTQAEYFRGHVSLFQSLGGGEKMAEALPGKGARPGMMAVSTGVVTAVPPRPGDGVNWNVAKADGAQKELYWQVELSGLYHQQTLGAAWRDLQARYPEQMKGHGFLPHLEGRLEADKDGQMAWYRLNVAKFVTVTAAHDFCLRLQADQQRCRVISSQSDETIPSPVGQYVVATVPSPIVVPPPVLPLTPVQAAPAQQALVQAVPGHQAQAPIAPVVVLTPPPSAPPQLVPPQTSPTAPVQVVTPVPVVAIPVRQAPPNLLDESGVYSVRLGTFSSLAEAEKNQAYWQLKPYDTYVNRILNAQGRPQFVVQSGIFLQRSEAQAWAGALEIKENIQVTVTPVAMDAEGRPVPLNSEIKVSSNKVIGAAAKTMFTIQIGVYSSLNIAVKELRRWQAKGYSVYVCQVPELKGGLRYALRTGSYVQLLDAAEQARKLGRKEKINANPVAAIVDSAGQLIRIDINALLKGQ